MSHINVEIKARCPDPERIRAILRSRDTEFKGTDHQIDTYFKVPAGRFKLREGNIENALIFYSRPDQAGPKQAEVSLCRLKTSGILKEVLADALGVLVVVKKERQIYFIGNVKFHVDKVDGLGSFVEIEALDTTGRADTDELTAQCREYMELFGISKEELACESWTRNCKAGIIAKAEAAPMEQWAWQIPSRSFEFCPADVRIYY